MSQTRKKHRREEKLPAAQANPIADREESAAAESAPAAGAEPKKSGNFSETSDVFSPSEVTSEESGNASSETVNETSSETSEVAPEVVGNAESVTPEVSGTAENVAPEATDRGEATVDSAKAAKELRRRERRAANQIVYSRGEERFNRISHLVGAGLAGVGTIAAVVKVSLAYRQVGALGIVSVSLFCLALILLYVMSTLYHWQPVGKRRRAVFRRFDHCSIALLIAGTYAPFMLIGMYSAGGATRVWAIVLASVVLGFAILSCVFNGIDVGRFRVFSLISYVVMGWACVVRIDLLIKAIPWQAFVMLLAGGVVYTAGIIFYRKRSIPYNHAIWHMFVLAGTILHYFAIYFYIIP